MSQSQKPIFVCIPAPCHPAIIYEPLKASLSLHGYAAVPLHLPSIGGNPPTYDFTEDVVAIRTLVGQISDAGNDVIVVVHGMKYGFSTKIPLVKVGEQVI